MTLPSNEALLTFSTSTESTGRLVRCIWNHGFPALLHCNGCFWGRVRKAMAGQWSLTVIMAWSTTAGALGKTLFRPVKYWIIQHRLTGKIGKMHLYLHLYMNQKGTGEVRRMTFIQVWTNLRVNNDRIKNFCELSL